MGAWHGPAARGFGDEDAPAHGGEKRTRSDAAAGGTWRERGFADFADGTFGNAGQKLCVSKAGVLQRFFRFVGLPLSGLFLPTVDCVRHIRRPA